MPNIPLPDHGIGAITHIENGYFIDGSGLRRTQDLQGSAAPSRHSLP